MTTAQPFSASTVEADTITTPITTTNPVTTDNGDHDKYAHYVLSLIHI